MNGQIARILHDKGFGFIREGSNEYFFHRSDVQGSVRFAQLEQGNEVTFDLGKSDRGPRAANVRKV